jgi:hypothetical protein
MTTPTQPATENASLWDKYFKEALLVAFYGDDVEDGWEESVAAHAARIADAGLAERRKRFPVEDPAFHELPVVKTTSDELLRKELDYWRRRADEEYARGKADGAREERDRLLHQADEFINSHLRATPEPKP